MVAWRAIVLLGVVALALPGALRALPTIGQYLVAEANDPASLPALPREPRVHYEAGAIECALRVAGILPSAVARIERDQQRPFAAPPIVGVYATQAQYTRANAMADVTVLGASRAGRIVLSPQLCGARRDSLVGVLTHELSHAHFFGWRSTLRPRPPGWFTEGLAVMVADGGGSEPVDDAEAVQALRDGYVIVVEDSGAWREPASIPFETEPPDLARKQPLAYRQAGLFLAWLRDRAPEKFAGLLVRLEDGASFGPTIRAVYGQDVRSLSGEFRAAPRPSGR